MLFDFYQQRTKEYENQVGGMASNFTYDWEMLGAACGMEVDYVLGSDALHVDVKMFSARDYRLAWLLVIPAWNWVKGTIARIRSGGGELKHACRPFLTSMFVTLSCAIPCVTSR
jgi:hypothetical protein